MKILFLNPPFGHQRPEGLDAPLGIMQLAAVLKQKGHQCELVDHAWQTPGDWSAWRQALDNLPDMVLINTQIRFEQDSINGAEMARGHNPGPGLMAFGPQASTQPRHLLEAAGLDACIVGEPEELLPRLLEDWPQALELDLPGLATRRAPEPEAAPRIDPMSLPRPEYELADYGRYIATTNNAVYMASRGLNQVDAFNQPPLIYAHKPEMRLSPERVIEDLTWLRGRFPGSYMLLFHDEVFSADRTWTLELCARLGSARLELPFWCFTRPDCLEPELAQVMAKAGFAGVSMGMESGSRRILDYLGRGVSPGRIEQGFAMARSAGLLTLGSVMLGTPGETPEDIEATVNLAGRIKPDRLTVSITTPLPGTDLYARHRADLLAETGEDFNYLHTWPGKYPMRLEHMSAEDLTQAVRRVHRAAQPGLLGLMARSSLLAMRNPGFRSNFMGLLKKKLQRG